MGSPLGPPPTGTVANVRVILRRASATIPYHNLLEYKLYNQLEDPQLSTVVHLVNIVLSGTPVPQIHFADFINLPKKIPHRPVANGRPDQPIHLVENNSGSPEGSLPTQSCQLRGATIALIWDLPQLFICPAPPCAA